QLSNHEFFVPLGKKLIAEIAEITGSSLGTVKSRISRGREELRGLLAHLRPGTGGGERSVGGRDE
ncbi:MAG: sigma factor-like helix-turn-helix DNA-binding protein, partial [Candidatus Limnocylindrus sp.]